MKTLKKCQLEDLKKEMLMLNCCELLSVIGGDRYIFNKEGVWTDTIEDNGPDIIEVSGATYTLEEGTIFQSGQSVGVAEGKSGIIFENAQKGLFEFFANNTDVEWGMSYNDSGKEKNKPVVITSNYSSNTCDIVPRSGYNSYVHSHPNSNPKASPDDSEQAQLYTELPNVASHYDYDNFYVYTPKKRNGEKYHWVDPTPQTNPE